MNIPMTLAYLRPDEEWTLDGESFDGLTWLSSTPKPTQAELESAWPAVQAEMEAKAQAAATARTAAIEHAKSLGFTDDMIAVMYPSLTG